MSTTDAPATIDPSELAPLEPRCEWRCADLGDSYVFQLTDAHVDELGTALRAAESEARDVLDITRDSFPLPTLGPVLTSIARELIEGRGNGRYGHSSLL